MDQLTALRSDARKIGDQISAIESEQRKTANGAKVGCYFRTRNGYSCPQKPSDYWWLYAKCTRMDDDGFLYAFKFQTDCHGKIEIEEDAHSYHMQHYEPCSKVEFDRAWHKLRKRVQIFTL